MAATCHISPIVTPNQDLILSNRMVFPAIREVISALSSLSPEKKTIIFAIQDFHAKEMILAIMLENKASNPVSVSCLKVG